MQLPAGNSGLDLLPPRYGLEEGLQTQMLTETIKVTGYVQNNKNVGNREHWQNMPFQKNSCHSIMRHQCLLF